MGFERLNEDLDWEGRRIAAAFGIPDAEFQINPVQTPAYSDSIRFFGQPDLEVQAHEKVIDMVQIGVMEVGYCEVWRNDDTGEWSVEGEPQEMCDLMGRALYLLRLDDQVVFDELKFSLTEQEEVELRRSWPREYWPKKWLEEEKPLGV